MGSAPSDRVGSGFSWRHAGAGAATPVLLLHGVMGSRLSWEPQLDALGVGRVVVAWDAPGFGSSVPLAAPGFSAYTDAVAALLDHLGWQRVHLVGLSFGGMIAQHVAIRHSDRLASLALLATSPKFGLDGITTADAWRAARLAALDAGSTPQDLAPTVLAAIAGPGIDAGALAGQVHAADPVHPAGLRTVIDTLVNHDVLAALTDIHTPTLCLVGALDAETPVAYAARLATGIAAARLEVVPDAGHLLNAEAPTQVNALLEAHFADHEEPS